MLIVGLLFTVTMGASLKINKVHGETIKKITENIAYGRTATASSVESDEYLAANAVDADGNTRWASQHADNQYLMVDLWSVQTVGR